MKQAILQAAKATSIPEGWSGLWYVRKLDVPKGHLVERHGQYVWARSGIITYLHRITDATIHTEPPGEVIMEDTIYELRTHLNFMLRAYGNVLVTGLGLGCVVRGLLASPRVSHVTCIENSEDVLNLVGPYMPKERLEIVDTDALHWCQLIPMGLFDCAWHDLCSIDENGDPSLHKLHSKLLMCCARKVTFQGAWAFPREIKRAWRNHGFNII